MIELTLPLPTPSLNYTLGRHWSRKAKLRKQWAWMVRAERLRLLRSGELVDAQIADGLQKITGGQFERPSNATIERWGPRLLDHDNFVAGAKQLIDALVAEGFLVDDSPAHLQATYRQHVGKPYRTEVRIE